MIFGDALRRGKNAAYEESKSIRVKGDKSGLCTYTLVEGRDSSVGMATRHGLVGPGIKFR